MYDFFQNDGPGDATGLTAGTRQTAHEYVREVLRRSILNGDLPGGSRLVQAELAATLEVSTTPIREALRDLASEGLVRFDPHRGAVVTELDDEDLRDRLVQKGLARARKFSWERSVRAIHSGYLKALGRSSPALAETTR